MKSTNSETVNLHTLASWYYPEIENKEKVMVSIPRLQRGLVWRPQQVELLWDSILRGYPIGCFVISNAIKKQNKEASEKAKLHLLDGQQRSNAIAVGFHNPYSDKNSDSKESNILWLDLNPKNHYKGTRVFILRLTKIAHPWGYKLDDQCSRLSANEIRESLDELEGTNEFKDKRALPAELKPHKASYPIPLSFLLEAATKCDSKEEGAKYLEGVLNKLTQKWASEANALFSDDDYVKGYFSKIWLSLKRALNAEIVLLKAPEELVGTDDEDCLEDVELLFQRLNTQGTPLNGEELSYSMIKTYFPEVVDTIEAIKNLRMNPSRLVHLATRAALTNTDSDRLHGGVDINRLRRLMKDQDGSDKEYKEIKSYCTDLEGLPRYSKKIDSWLCYDKEKSAKLPNYIVSNIASGSREIYLLLLVWAKLDDDNPLSTEVIEVIPGLATLLRWFSLKLDLDHCCNLIHKSTRDGISLEHIRLGIKNAIEEGHLISPNTPEDMRQFIGNFSEMNLDKDEFDKWKWWESLITLGEEQNAYMEREKKWSHFLNKIRWQKELLLYCQRHYLWERFEHYDQSNTMLWEDHNRPWDYDHILARNCVVGKRWNNMYKSVSLEWVNTIGNLWACPFEDNRRYSNRDASAKLSDEFFRNSFMTEDEFKGFDHGQGTVSNEGSARGFCNSSRSRLLNLYEEWYNKAQVGMLLK